MRFTFTNRRLNSLNEKKKKTFHFYIRHFNCIINSISAINTSLNINHSVSLLIKPLLLFAGALFLLRFNHIYYNNKMFQIIVIKTRVYRRRNHKNLHRHKNALKTRLQPACVGDHFRSDGAKGSAGGCYLQLVLCKSGKHRFLQNNLWFICCILDESTASKFKRYKNIQVRSVCTVFIAKIEFESGPHTL